MRVLLLLLISVTFVSVAYAEQVGDMNGDGVIGVAEAIIALQVASGQTPSAELGSFTRQEEWENTTHWGCVEGIYDHEVFYQDCNSAFQHEELAVRAEWCLYMENFLNIPGEFHEDRIALCQTCYENQTCN